MVPENGEKTLLKTLYALIHSKNNSQSAWNVQQQQRPQQQHTLVSTGTHVGEQNGGNRSSYIKATTGTLVAEEENPLQVDLRIQEVVDKLRTGYQTESIMKDLKKKGNPTCSAKRQDVQLENREILNCMNWEISTTVQCPACFRYAPEGIFDYTCGVCLMPSSEQKRIWKLDLKL